MFSCCINLLYCLIILIINTYVLFMIPVWGLWRHLCQVHGNATIRARLMPWPSTMPPQHEVHATTTTWAHSNAAPHEAHATTSVQGLCLSSPAVCGAATAHTRFMAMLPTACGAPLPTCHLWCCCPPCKVWGNAAACTILVVLPLPT